MKKFLLFFVALGLVLTLSACSSNSMDQGSNNTNSNSLIGEWVYEGTINNKYYDINLDLESNNTFTLDIDEESSETSIDSEAKGTYTFDDKTLTLSIVTVQNPESYFGNTVVENGQIEFNYELTNNSLKLENISEVITFLPDDITLTKDF